MLKLVRSVLRPKGRRIAPWKRLGMCELDLIRIADAQIDKAKSDLSVARLGLAEVELELTSRGVRSAEHGSDGEGGAQ